MKQDENKVLLDVEHLTIAFKQNGDLLNVVNDISFQIKTGEILGIVGESGSGKTMTSLSIMGLLSKEATIPSGSITFEGRDLLKLDGEEYRKLKGNQMAMIFQEPMTSLNPVMTVGYQIEEMLLLHEKGLDEKERKAKTIEALQEAGLGDAEIIYKKYPHQLSGGMRQRAMIAMAMICKPKLLIADEPTTALDVTIQAKILELIQRMSEKYGIAVILISHDLGVIKKICSRAIVMQNGIIVEQGTVHELFLKPEKDYTKKLIASMPSVTIRRQEDEAIEENETIEKIEVIEKSEQIKQNEVVEINIFTEQNEEIEKYQVINENKVIDKEEEAKDQSKQVSEEIILEVNNLNVFYEENTKNLFSKKHKKQVVHDVSLHLKRGEILGIVGESGSGKSTLAKAIVGLIKDRTGEIHLKDLKPQMVFQDPYGSLNPVKRVNWILEEPLKLAGGYSKKERKEKVAKILNDIGLQEKHGTRYLSQLSGGQRQRVAIGVALIQNSKLIVLDEPVSALDVTVQAQILELLKKLQQEYELSYLFISHDLNVIYLLCDRVSVMFQGKIVETATVKELFNNPNHPYSKKLLKSIVD